MWLSQSDSAASSREALESWGAIRELALPQLLMTPCFWKNHLTSLYHNFLQMLTKTWECGVGGENMAVAWLSSQGLCEDQNRINKGARQIPCFM